MIEEFQRENGAIYDDTGNMHRAVAMADAYYDDESVLEYNGLTGRIIDIFCEKNIMLIEDTCESHGQLIKGKSGDFNNKKS